MGKVSVHHTVLEFGVHHTVLDFGVHHTVLDFGVHHTVLITWFELVHELHCH